MQQAIAEGHALNVMEALEVVKTDLQTMNADMQVSQEEYAEISTIKPLFLNADYKVRNPGLRLAKLLTTVWFLPYNKFSKMGKSKEGMDGYAV